MNAGGLYTSVTRTEIGVEAAAPLAVTAERVSVYTLCVRKLSVAEGCTRWGEEAMEERAQDQRGAACASDLQEERARGGLHSKDVCGREGEVKGQRLRLRGRKRRRNDVAARCVLSQCAVLRWDNRWTDDLRGKSNKQ